MSSMFTNFAKGYGNRFQASASAVATPMSPMALTITLTPVDDSDEVRRLILVPGEPVKIGRASNAKSKHLEASSCNAFFDCPVISREHAELRVHPWAIGDEQVSITDLNSMHGTRVNGKVQQPDKRRPLHNGDLIQFGEKVTRGSDSHEGIVVTFDRVNSSNTQASQNTFAASQPNRGYHVPEYSDEDQSDSQSDVISIVSNDDDIASSAKTTPEQASAKPGSQESPIDVDTVRVRPLFPQSIIIDDDDDQPKYPKATYKESSISPTDTIAHDSVKVIQDSVDKDGDIFVCQSRAKSARGFLVAGSPSYHPKSPEYPYRPTSPGSDDGNKAKSPGPASVSGDSRDDDEASELEERMISREDAKEDEGIEDDVSLAYDEDASDEDQAYGGSPIHSDDEDDESDESETGLYTKKQPSPELGSTTEYTSPASVPQPASNYNTWAFKPSNPPSSQPKPASSYPRYDPVHTPQSPKLYPDSYVPSQASQEFNRRQYTYDYPRPSYARHDPYSLGPSSNFYGSSRWDVAPSAPSYAFAGYAPVEPAAPRSNQYALPPSQSLNHYYDPVVPKLRSAIPHGLPPSQQIGGGVFGFQHSWDSAPAPSLGLGPYSFNSLSQEASLPSESNVSKAAVSAPTTASSTNKISIPDIVEASAAEKKEKEDDVTQEVLQKTSTTTSSKRKAAEISTGDEEEQTGASTSFLVDLSGVQGPDVHSNCDFSNFLDHVDQQELQSLPLPLPMTSSELAERPARRRKIKRASRPGVGAIMEAAKIAGGAVLGGVATMAFLCSPLAERALEWLA